MQKSRLIVLLVLVAAALVIGGYFLYRGSAASRAGASALDQGQQRNFYCENCKNLFRLTFRKLPPQVCPKCNQPAAFRADMARCKACGKDFPLLLHRWSTEEKARGEKLLADKEFLTAADVDSLMRSKQTKTTTRDWMPYAEAYEKRREFRCPHCSNTDPARLEELDQPSL